MDHVKVCPGCETLNAITAFSCEKCDTDLRAVQPVLRQAAERRDRQPQRVCPHCLYDGNTVDAAECARCSRPLRTSDPQPRPQPQPSPPAYCVRFPFGDVPITGLLRIGREETFSTIARQLASYDKVSREHAELDARGGPLTVTDLASMNHVYVNGRQIEAKARTTLNVGDEIWFSRELRATIVASGGAR